MGLFGWLARRRDPLARGLYRYHDGRRWRFGDPIRVDAQLKKHGGENWGDLLAVLKAAGESIATGRLAQIVQAQAEQALLSLADLSRKAFDLAPLDDDGRGLSDGESLKVMMGYLSFIASLKERWGPLPNAPRNRECPSPAEQDTGEWSPPSLSSPTSAGGGPKS